ncbi:MAG: NAD-binding protein [Rhizobiales bacterium]|nr:NAD-binding protein [Hyphomicrobiales bacterium]
MGSRMAAHLVRAGYAVTVFDIAAERARLFASEHQARATDRLADLASSADAVVTMLPSGREVREAVLEMQGGALAQNLRPGSIVIDMSSAAPVGTRELGQVLAARGIGLVDAPVSGGIIGAEKGTLAIMIGGEPDTIATARPVLERMGNRLFEVGGLGCGHAMKCLNNFLAGASFAAASEAVRVGRKFGLDPAVMIDVINVSTGRSFASDVVMKEHVLNEKFATGFALGLLAKDVGIAADLAEQIDVHAPIGELIRDLFRDASDGVGGSEDHSRAATWWDRHGLRPAAE